MVIRGEAKPNPPAPCHLFPAMAKLTGAALYDNPARKTLLFTPTLNHHFNFLK
jgi:hypothetical protein